MFVMYLISSYCSFRFILPHSYK